MSKLSLRLIAASAFVALGLTSAATGQDVLQDKGGISVSAAGHAITLPSPLWLAVAENGADLSENVSVFRQTVPGGEMVEIIHPNEEFESWTHMTSTFVMSREAMPPDMHVQLLVQAFQENCEEDKLAFRSIEPPVEGGRPLVMMVCGQFTTNLVQTGEGLGEILVMTIVEAEHATARVYVEWRGSAFDVAESATWPVPSVDELNTTLLRLSSGAAISALK